MCRGSTDVGKQHALHVNISKAIKSDGFPSEQARKTLVQEADSEANEGGGGGGSRGTVDNDAKEPIVKTRLPPDPQFPHGSPNLP